MMLKVSSGLDYLRVVDGGVVLGQDFKKIPREIFSHLLDLVIYLSKKELEVLFYLNYDYSNNYVITIPPQIIGKYKVEIYRESNCKDIDLEGNEITQPLIRLGSFHSHHYLDSIFSLEDDISDFSSPPGLHILIGNYPNLYLASSFTINRTRYTINPISVIDYSHNHCYEEHLAKAKYKAISKNIRRKRNG